MTQLSRFQTALGTTDADAAIISSELNIRYLCGFNYSDGYLLILPDKAYLLADFRYIEAARAAVTEFEVIRPDSDMLTELKFLMNLNQVSTVAIEDASLSCADFAKFKEKFEYEFIYRDTRKLHQAELRGIQHKEPVYESSYLVKGEGMLSRKGSDGKIRTSVYQCVGLLMEEHFLCLGVQNFSLVGEGDTEPSLMKVYYEDLSRVVLGENYPQMHLVLMEIYNEDGSLLMSCQMKADAQTDELVADLNNKIKKSHED